MSEVKWCIKHQLPHCPSLHCISVYGSMFSVPHRQMYDGMEGRKTKKERDRQTDRHKQINRTKSIRRHVAHWITVAQEIVSYMERHFHSYCIYCRQIQQLSCQSFLLLLHWHIWVKGCTWTSGALTGWIPTPSLLTPSFCHPTVLWTRQRTFLGEGNNFCFTWLNPESFCLSFIKRQEGAFSLKGSRMGQFECQNLSLLIKLWTMIKKGSVFKSLGQHTSVTCRDFTWQGNHLPVPLKQSFQEGGSEYSLLIAAPGELGSVTNNGSRGREEACSPRRKG